MDDKLSKLKEKQAEIGDKISVLQKTNKKKDEEAAEIRQLIAECRENLNRIKSQNSNPDSDLLPEKEQKDSNKENNPNKSSEELKKKSSSIVLISGIDDTLAENIKPTQTLDSEEKLDSKKRQDSGERPDSIEKRDSKERQDSKEKQDPEEKKDAKERQASGESPDAMEKRGLKETDDSSEGRDPKDKSDSKEEQDLREKPDSKERQDLIEKPDSRERQDLMEKGNSKESQISGVKPNLQKQYSKGKRDTDESEYSGEVPVAMAKQEPRNRPDKMGRLVSKESQNTEDPRDSTDSQDSEKKRESRSLESEGGDSSRNWKKRPAESSKYKVSLPKKGERVSCKVDLNKMKVRIRGPSEDLKKLDATQLINLLEKFQCQELIINTGEDVPKDPGEIRLVYLAHPGNLVMIAGLILTAFLFNANLSDVSSPFLLNLLYLSSLASHYGMVFWMTFIRCYTLKFGLNYDMYHLVDNIILPKYFSVCVLLSALSLYSFLATQIKAPLTSWLLEDLIQLLVLVMTFVMELTTISYFIPALIKLRHATDDYLSEDEEPETPAPPSYGKNSSKLAKLNWTMFFVNFLTLVFLGANIHYITNKLIES